jgi:hypothetical protein
MTPEQFLAKLAALVPPPHQNLVRYAGCFANRHHLRPRIVPPGTGGAGVVASEPTQLRLFDFTGKPLSALAEHNLAAPRMQPRSWSWLLARVFAIDIETCPRRACRGRLKIVDVVVDPEHIALHLHGARAPPRAPPPGQLTLLPT